ncbi:MAG: selenocysteine-specific translation elongation factor [Candidatus Eiseniibacteriota bacterium]
MERRSAASRPDPPAASRPVVLGTAGHIDHGKTALVGRLTGINTDRLKEEQERGISIDLGFAPLTLPSGRRVAIVDVPGHERFVKNMLAGATGIDLVLLVVAADDGVMPQTREHFAIVDLLGAKRGLVALTKADLAGPDRIERSRAAVRALLAGTALAEAPILPVSSVTGEGVPELLRALDEEVSKVEGRKSDGASRLPVDRVFSIEGIGTVVTGTLWSGSIRPGDNLTLLPEDRAVRVRQVEVHDQTVEVASAGNRTAVAIHGVSREEVKRGDWLVTRGRFRATEMLDVTLRLLDGLPKPLANRARVRIHIGASEVLGRVVLFGAETLAPGASAYAQLRLEGALIAARGDIGIVRAYSPSVTIGGAAVLDPAPARRQRLDAADRERLAAMESGSLADALHILVREASFAGLSSAAAAVRLNAEPEEIEAAFDEARLVRARDGRLLARASFSAARERVLDAVRSYAEEHRLRHGAPKGEIKSRLVGSVEGAVFDEVLETLVAEGKLVASGERISAPGDGPTLTREQAAAMDRLEAKLGAEGFQVPGLSEALRDLPAGLDSGELVRHMIESGRAVRVTSEMLYPQALWSEIEKRVRAHFTRRPSLTMAEFKDLLQVSRKYAVPLLELLDRTGLTRREGDNRAAGPRAKA